jgi:hypothetical protein
MLKYLYKYTPIKYKDNDGKITGITRIWRLLSVTAVSFIVNLTNGEHIYLGFMAFNFEIRIGIIRWNTPLLPD